MKASFLTSLFEDGFTDEFIAELNKYMSNNHQFVFVASDFSVHERTEHYLRIFLRYFEDKGVCFDSARIIDNEVSPEEAIGLIENAGVVWLCGGPTLTQISDIKRYGLVKALRNREGITIGMSAGSINMGTQVVLAKDLNDGIPETVVYDGIGLVDFNIEPHINTASREHIADVEGAAKIAPIYGLHDNAFIVDIDGEMKIFGECVLFS